MADENDEPPLRRSIRKAPLSTYVAQRNAKVEIRKKVKRVSEILRKPEHERTAADRALVHKHPEIVKTSQSNARRLRANKERLLEIEDEAELLKKKCEQLADMIKSSKSIVVYTGAGISTAASIPDYRGPNGVWTLLKKGQELSPQDLSDAEPTFTHMCITKLFRVGRVKHVVSQNCDGLHIRSGYPRYALSEVHGNMFIECCYSCKPHKEYIRLFDVTEKTGVRRHTTSRRCKVCNSHLKDSIIHFGEKGKLHSPYRWKEAVRAAKRADLILCLGSSLKVLRRYSCLWCMDMKPQHRPKLVIVNLQWTPKDDVATLKINGRCDDVLTQVMDLLDYEVPEYKREADPIFRLCTPLRASELKSTNKKILTAPPVEPKAPKPVRTGRRKGGRNSRSRGRGHKSKCEQNQMDGNAFCEEERELGVRTALGVQEEVEDRLASNEFSISVEQLSEKSVSIYSRKYPMMKNLLGLQSVVDHNSQNLHCEPDHGKVRVNSCYVNGVKDNLKIDEEHLLSQFLQAPHVKSSTSSKVKDLIELKNQLLVTPRDFLKISTRPNSLSDQVNHPPYFKGEVVPELLSIGLQPALDEGEMGDVPREERLELVVVEQQPTILGQETSELASQGGALLVSNVCSLPLNIPIPYLHIPAAETFSNTSVQNEQSEVASTIVIDLAVPESGCETVPQTVVIDLEGTHTPAPIGSLVPEVTVNMDTAILNSSVGIEVSVENTEASHHLQLMEQRSTSEVSPCLAASQQVSQMLSTSSATLVFTSPVISMSMPTCHGSICSFPLPPVLVSGTDGIQSAKTSNLHQSSTAIVNSLHSPIPSLSFTFAPTPSSSQNSISIQSGISTTVPTNTYVSDNIYSVTLSDVGSSAHFLTGTNVLNDCSISTTPIMPASAQETAREQQQEGAQDSILTPNFSSLASQNGFQPACLGPVEQNKRSLWSKVCPHLSPQMATGLSLVPALSSPELTSSTEQHKTAVSATRVQTAPTAATKISNSVRQILHSKCSQGLASRPHSSPQMGNPHLVQLLNKAPRFSRPEIPAPLGKKPEVSAVPVPNTSAISLDHCYSQGSCVEANEGKSIAAKDMKNITKLPFDFGSVKIKEESKDTCVVDVGSVSNRILSHSLGEVQVKEEPASTPQHVRVQDCDPNPVALDRLEQVDKKNHHLFRDSMPQCIKATVLPKPSSALKPSLLTRNGLSRCGPHHKPSDSSLSSSSCASQPANREPATSSESLPLCPAVTCETAGVEISHLTNSSGFPAIILNMDDMMAVQNSQVSSTFSLSLPQLLSSPQVVSDTTAATTTPFPCKLADVGFSLSGPGQEGNSSLCVSGHSSPLTVQLVEPSSPLSTFHSVASCSTAFLSVASCSSTFHSVSPCSSSVSPHASTLLSSSCLKQRETPTLLPTKYQTNAKQLSSSSVNQVTCSLSAVVSQDNEIHPSPVQMEKMLLPSVCQSKSPLGHDKSAAQVNRSEDAGVQQSKSGQGIASRNPSKAEPKKSDESAQDKRKRLGASVPGWFGKGLAIKKRRKL